MANQKKHKHLLVHLSSVHPPFDTRIFHKQCTSLAQNGYDVSLIISHDKKEMINGIQIIPLKKAINRLYRMTRTVWQVCCLALSEKGKIYHFHDPELMPVGIYLKMKGKKVIYDVHENVPDQILDKHWIPHYLRKLVAKIVGVIERIGSQFFDGIVAATPTIGNRFPAKKTIIVQNFPKLNFECIQEQKVPYSQRENIVIYVGAITELRGINKLVESMDFISKELKAQLYLVGEFVPEDLLLKTKKISGWSHITFFGWKPQKHALSLLELSKVGVVLFQPTKAHINSLPNKIFEYMSVGLPIVASNFQLWSSIVEKNKCGLLVDPLNPKAIAQAIQWLLENPKEAEEMGRRGQAAFLHSYNWDSEERKLLQLYQRILA